MDLDWSRVAEDDQELKEAKELYRMP